MFVVFLRHATRDSFVISLAAEGDQHDQHLNELGRRQATELVGLTQSNGPLPKPTILMSSPKHRARETLQPLATVCQSRVLILPELDERGNNETHSMFIGRIREWVETLQAKASPTDVVYACSHYDWLTEVLGLIPSTLSDNEQNSGFAPAEFRIFEIREGIWYLSPDPNVEVV